MNIKYRKKNENWNNCKNKLKYWWFILKIQWCHFFKILCTSFEVFLLIINSSVHCMWEWESGFVSKACLPFATTMKINLFSVS